MVKFCPCPTVCRKAEEDGHINLCKIIVCDYFITQRNLCKQYFPLFFYLTKFFIRYII